MKQNAAGRRKSDPKEAAARRGLHAPGAHPWGSRGTPRPTRARRTPL